MRGSAPTAHASRRTSDGVPERILPARGALDQRSRPTDRRRHADVTSRTFGASFCARTTCAISAVISGGQRIGPFDRVASIGRCCGGTVVGT